jgi:hypothetical protein
MFGISDRDFQLLLDSLNQFLPFRLWLVGGEQAWAEGEIRKKAQCQGEVESHGRNLQRGTSIRQVLSASIARLQTLIMLPTDRQWK